MEKKVRFKLWPEGSERVGHVDVWGNVFQARGVIAQRSYDRRGKMKKLEGQEHHEEVTGNGVRETTEDLFM